MKQPKDLIEKRTRVKEIALTLIRECESKGVTFSELDDVIDLMKTFARRTPIKVHQADQNRHNA